MCVRRADVERMIEQRRAQRAERERRKHATARARAERRAQQAPPAGFVSLVQAVEILGVTRRWFDRRRARGDFPTVRVGPRIFIPLAALSPAPRRAAPKRALQPPAPRPSAFEQARARAGDGRRMLAGTKWKSISGSTLNLSRVEREEFAELQHGVIEDGLYEGRPRTVGDCESDPESPLGGASKPCPWVSCRFHMYLSVKTGRRDAGGRELAPSLQLHFPHIEPDQLSPEGSCVLALARRGGMEIEEVGRAINVTVERVRQMFAVVRTKLRDVPVVQDGREQFRDVDAGRVGAAQP